MNEITKEYYSEVASRSITAKSAHAKNGQNSEKLGNRQLTRKEIEEKHGPVKTYTFDDFLTFSEFREMPLDWQAGYINRLQDKYDIGLTQINRDLFGCRDDNQLRSHLKLKGILDKVNPDKRRGRTKLHEFRSDIREYRMNPAPKAEQEKPAMGFVNYETFKSMKPSAQATFINRVIAEYGVGIKNIGEDLFGMKNGNVLTMYLKRKLPDGMITAKRNQGDTRSAAYKAKFERFRRDIQLWKATGAVTVEAASIVEVPRKTMPELAEIEAKVEESIQKLNDRVEKGETITVNDVNEELGLEPVSEEKNAVIAEPAPVSEMTMGFSTSYISTGIDMDRVALINQLFAGQKVRVKIEVEVL